MNKIDIKGAIVPNDDAWIYDLFEMEHTSPKMIDDKISDIDGKEVIIEINSGGGSVFAGSEIYTKLKKLNANVEIVGLAGSAASVIAMAGKKVSISPTAQIMIHNASTIRAGDKHSMNDAGQFLDSIDSSIAYAYQLKTGLEISDIAEMMSKETWFNAQQAVEKGFADEIMFSVPDAVASVGVMLPENVINKVRNVIKKEPSNQDSNLEELKQTILAMQEQIIDIKQNQLSIQQKYTEEPKQQPTNNGWLF